MGYLSEDSLVILLLCSNLGLDKSNKDKPRPFTTLQWQKLSERMINSSLNRPEKLLQYDIEEYKSALNLKIEEAERIQYLLSRKINIAIEIENLKSKGIFITTRAEKNYPIKLKRVLKKKCPPVIYYAGDIKLANLNTIAVVGSRNVDDIGINFTRQLSQKCVKSGFVVVSGGARGVDSISESTAINNGGKAISIVSDSLAKKIMIKANRDAITKNMLLMISVVHPNAIFKGFNAMDRNKYIYTMADYSVVVSSDYNKGGTWSGAVENIKNSWTPLLVRADDDIPNGNQQLIKKGGIPILSANVSDGFDLRKWLEERKVSSKKEENIQLSLYDSINKTETKVKINIYDIVIDKIIESLDIPLSLEELSTKFNVINEQMNLWMNIAVEKGLVFKTIEPVKYIKKSGSN